MYKFLALAAAVAQSLIWQSRVAGLILLATLLGVFLTVMFQSTRDAKGRS